MRWERALAAAAAVTVPVAILLSGGFGRDPHAVPFERKDQPAPPMALPRLDGLGEVSLRDLVGRPVVVNFWASWCGPCAAEHEALRAASASWRGRAHFVGVVFHDEPADARAYLQERGEAYPSLLDRDDRAAIDFGITGVPETFFLDARGILRARHVGAVTEASLARVLSQLEAGGPLP